MTLVALSVVEQRLDAVRAVLAGASVTEVRRRSGVSRQASAYLDRDGHVDDVCVGHDHILTVVRLSDYYQMLGR